VYLRWNPLRTAELIAASVLDRRALAEQLSARVAGLDDLLGRPVDTTEVTASFESALTQLVGITPVDADWSAAEQALHSADLERYAAIVIAPHGKTEG
jgi:hypothetical protein